MAYVTIFLCWKKTQYKSTFRNFIPNLPVSAILVLPVFSRIFQYLQYWYYQYFPESSSICNTGITSISQNPPVSAILVLPVIPRIFRYLQYSYFANDQYLLVLQILENSGRYWDTSIYQYCRYWKILVKYWYYQYCNTSIAAGCFILSVHFILMFKMKQKHYSVI